MQMLLHQLIHDAFHDTHPPSRPFTCHRCTECNEVDALLGGRTWQDVAADFPDYCHDSFPLLTPDAQAYFLPAYMLAAIGPEANMQGTSLESALEERRLSPENFTNAPRAAVVRWMAAYWQSDGSDAPADLIDRWQT
jgi:hypothetical protein